MSPSSVKHKEAAGSSKIKEHLYQTVYVMLQLCSAAEYSVL